MPKKILPTAFALAIAACSASFCPAQTAHFAHFRYDGHDQRFDKQIDSDTQYLNPILAGFYPDPSICRKGDTYYLANSSFAFFPGVPIFTSRNLVDWTLVGHALDRESQLPLEGQGVSGGIFAPAISYNEHNQTFYMITTNVGRGNFYVKTTDPAHGWSEPIYLPQVGGIDPSFFFDSDGRAYIVNNDAPTGQAAYDGQRAIKLHYFDVDADSVYGDEIEIVRGGTTVEQRPIWIEGPHLYRVGEYYYLMCAEGGTGSWHSEVIFRSKRPEGPWEEYKEGNPILTQRTGLDPDRPDIVTSAGHADLIETPDGQWWAVFLACRPYEGDLYNTGRDTYLLPVTWREGWPTILEHGLPVPTVCERPKLASSSVCDHDTHHQLSSPTMQGHKEATDVSEETTAYTGNFDYTDMFNGPTLHSRWMFLRNPTPFWRLTGHGLDIEPKAATLAQTLSPAAIFTRQQHTCFEAETQLTFNPATAKQLAGIALLQNERHHIVLGKTIRNGQPAVVLIHANGDSIATISAPLSKEEANAPLRLRVRGRGRYYDFFYASQCGNWRTLARGIDAACLSTNVSGGFIGACIGLYATTGEER